MGMPKYIPTANLVRILLLNDLSWIPTRSSFPQLSPRKSLRGFLAGTVESCTPYTPSQILCVIQRRLEPVSSSLPERVLWPLGCQIFRGEGKREESYLLLKLSQYIQIMTIHYSRDRDWWHRHIIRAITWEVGESGSGPCSNEYLIINMRWNSSFKPG